jgi:peptide/nickel transport system permease protein
MPWIVLAAGSAAVFARLIRGSMIETMKEDYIRTARAKGLPERKVVRQGVRASINPIVTLLALEIGVLLGGAILVETVFNIPGVGRLSYNSIINSDFSVIQGTVLLASMFIIVANILADIAYAYLDPRVRY